MIIRFLNFVGKLGLVGLFQCHLKVSGNPGLTFHISTYEFIINMILLILKYQILFIAHFGYSVKMISDLSVGLKWTPFI